jgi:phosphopantothenoylcysteine decarboxylase/phosphopantothenate--cysteine ligase
MKSRPEIPPAGDLDGREVLVAVGGGIAAYKVCDVVSQLVQRGAGVTVAMTPAAQHFVGPMTFQALTGRGVMTDQWNSADSADIQHIALTGRAKVFLVAPATANLIGKIACGIADDLVTTLVISADCPLVLAPAMNDRMWRNPAVQKNVAMLKERGVTIVGPASGWLACRSVGMGRLADPDEIIEHILPFLAAAPA